MLNGLLSPAIDIIRRRARCAACYSDKGKDQRTAHISSNEWQKPGGLLLLLKIDKRLPANIKAVSQVAK